jgi:hypothetical protein
MSEYQLLEFLVQNGMGMGSLGVVVGYFVLMAARRQRQEAQAREAEKVNREAESERLKLEHASYFDRLNRITEILEEMKAESDKRKIEEAAIEAYIEREVTKRSSAHKRIEVKK